MKAEEIASDTQSTWVKQFVLTSNQDVRILMLFFKKPVVENDET